ncbi:MAG: autotransporter-associated beta strand repeat-containing protein, partial [Verrucomicrobia bacterium]|nr:autotransporter-associated beta strand repeat-containing protein [Verrucomicrobiota bacterium]
MKTSYFRCSPVRFGFAGLLLAVALPVQAASSSWLADVDGLWSAVGSWTGGIIPGATTTSNSTDVATFSITATAPRAVTVDTNRNVGGVTFSSDSATDVNGYVLSANTAAGKGATLKLSNGGVVQSVDGAGGAHTDTINSKIEAQGNGGTATFRNDSSGNTLVLGDITGVATAGNTNKLIFDGVSVALNSSTVISDGTNGGKLAVLKTGSGYWAFGTQSTFGGGLALGQGTLGFQGTGSLGLGAGGITVSNGTAFYHANANAITITNPVVVQGNFTFAGSDNATLGGPTDLAGGTRVITVSADSAIAGSISNGGLYVNGGSILTLSGANTYTNGTTFAGYVGLSLGHVNALGTGILTLNTSSGALYVGANLNSGAGVTNPIVLNAGYNRIRSATNWNANFSGVISDGGNFNSLEFSSLSDILAIIKLSAQNSWGDTYFKVGVNADSGAGYKLWMQLGVSDALPTAGLLTFDSASNARIYFDLSGFNQTVAGVSYGGPSIITNSAGSSTLTINTPAGTDYTASGQNCHIYGALEIVKIGDGTQRIGLAAALGGMPYSGGTRILGGTFVGGDNWTASGSVAITNALLQIDAGASVTIKSNLLGNTGATIDLNGGNLTITSGGSSVFAGAITNTGTLIKAGTGTLALSGANTYTGTTTNSAGTLLVNGSLAGGDVQVDAGTLGGSGTIGGAVSLASGAGIAPGNSAVGTLTLSNNLTLGGGGTLAYELVGVANSDKLVVRGNFSPVGTTTINLGVSAMTNGNYTLIEVSGTLGGSTNNFTVTGGVGGKAYSLAYQSGVTNKVVLTVTDGPRNPIWTGSGGTSSNLWDVNLSTNWSTAIAHDKFQNNDPATFNDTGLTNPVVNLTVAVSPSAVTVNSSGNYTFGGTGKITGTNALAKSGGGTLTLNSFNDYTGGTTNGAGAIALGHVTALGTGRLTMSGGALNIISNLNSGNGVTNAVTLKADSTISCATNWNAVWAGAITNDGTPRVLTFSSSCRTTSATNILNAANGWGDTVFSVGGSQKIRMVLGVDNALPTFGTVTNNGGTSAQITLDLNGHNQIIAGLYGVAGPADVLNGAATASALTINVAAGRDYTFSGQNRNISTAIKIVKTGDGTQRIAGVSGAAGGITYTGGTDIIGG